MSSGNYLQGYIDSSNNAYNVLLSGAPSGYTSSGLNIGGDTSTMYGVKLSKDATNNAYLDLRADLSNKMSLRYKDNTSGTVSSMLDLVNDSSLSSTSSYGAVVNGRVKASSYYAGSIDTRAPLSTGVYQGYDGNVGYFNINKGSGSGGFSFKTYNSDGSVLQSNLNLLASGVVQAEYYTATGNAADSETVAIAGMDASGNLVRNYAANARFRALEARATAIESDLTGGVPTKVNEIITRLNGLNFFSQNIATIAVFTPEPSSGPSVSHYNVVSVFVGSTTGATGNVNGTGTGALFNDILNCAINKTNGNLYISDLGNQCIRMVTSSAVVSTVISTGLWNPQGLYVDNTGTNLYICDTNNARIVKFNISTNTSSTLSTGWNYINYVYINNNGVLYANELNQGSIYTINTSTGVRTLLASGLSIPTGMVCDPNGNLYVCQQGSHCISKITPAGVVSLFAGSASSSTGFLDGTGSSARFNGPSDIKIDSYGNFYVCDTNNKAIRMINSSGVVTTITSGGVVTNNCGLALDASNNIYIANRGYNIIKISY